MGAGVTKLGVPLDHARTGFFLAGAERGFFALCAGEINLEKSVILKGENLWQQRLQLMVSAESAEQ
jgi:hypothetical protein